MNIAYCIRGRPRQLDAGYVQYMERIGSRHNVDVFIHTWRDKPKELRFRSSDWDRDLNKIVDLYNPISIAIENLPQHPEFSFKNSTIPIIKHDECINNYQNDQYSLMAVSNQVCRQSSQDYDYVIFSRFDLKFDTEVVYPKMNFGINHDHNGFCDLFIISKPSTSSHIGKFYPARRDLYLKNNQEFIPEGLLKQHLKGQEVEITGTVCTVI